MGDNCLDIIDEWETIPAFYDLLSDLGPVYVQTTILYRVTSGWWHCLALIGGNNYQKGLVIGFLIRSTLHWLALVHLRTSQKVTRPKPFLTWVNNDEVMVKTPDPKNNLEYRDQVQRLGWICYHEAKRCFLQQHFCRKCLDNISGWFMLEAAKLVRAGSRQRQKLALQQDLDRHRNFI